MASSRDSTLYRGDVSVAGIEALLRKWRHATTAPAERQPTARLRRPRRNLPEPLDRPAPVPYPPWTPLGVRPIRPHEVAVMRSSGCEKDNAHGVKFSGGCGARLDQRCP